MRTEPGLSLRDGAGGDLLALLAGALLTLAFAPVGWGWLAPLPIALLLWLWDAPGAMRAARRGLMFGLGLHGAGISWVFISLHTYGAAPAAFAALATALLILLMAAYPALLGALLVRLAPRPGPWRWLWLAPLGWLLLEWLRSWLFTGFPWLGLGYSQIDTPLAGYAPVTGVYPLAGLVVLLGGALRALAAGADPVRRLGAASVIAATITGGLVLGQIEWGRPQGAPLRLALVQGNVGQDLKWQPQSLAWTLERYVTLTRESRAAADLVVWPETAIPVFYDELEKDFIAPLQAALIADGVDLLTGVPTGAWETGVFHNAVASIGATPGIYQKRRLLPFGEYLPLRGLLEFFHDYVDIPMADFTPGAAGQPPLRAAGRAVGVSICFEIVFGAEIRRSLPDATLLVNVSNDAWFGRSLAPYQHLEIARMRALEFARPLARATNTGVSALIDGRGQVLARSGLFETTVVRGVLQPLAGSTPYARWGDAPAVQAAGVLALLGVAGARRRRG